MCLNGPSRMANTKNNMRSLPTLKYFFALLHHRHVSDFLITHTHNALSSHNKITLRLRFCLSPRFTRALEHWPREVLTILYATHVRCLIRFRLRLMLSRDPPHTIGWPHSRFSQVSVDIMFLCSSQMVGVVTNACRDFAHLLVAETTSSVTGRFL